MSTIELEGAEPPARRRAVPLAAAAAAVVAAAGAAFAAGHQLAAPDRPAPAGPGAGATAVPGTKIVTAGGWRGAVYEDTGVPVSAGIPQEP